MLKLNPLGDNMTITIQGQMLMGYQQVAGNGNSINAINPSTNETMQPDYRGGNTTTVDQACALAWSAFREYRNTKPEARAHFLESIAAQIEALGDQLTERAMAETGLPRARIEGERGRTCNQLRMFAGEVRSGRCLDLRIDPALPERQAAAAG